MASSLRCVDNQHRAVPSPQRHRLSPITKPDDVAGSFGISRYPVSLPWGVPEDAPVE